MKSENLSSSLEDYLETIFQLVKKFKVARVKDIAQELDVKKSSVTSALQNLSKKELINYDPYNYITLTKKGEQVAKNIFKSHNSIKNFLENVLCINSSVADENACRLEHSVDKSVVDKMVKFEEFSKSILVNGKMLNKEFSRFCKSS